MLPYVHPSQYCTPLNPFINFLKKKFYTIFHDDTGTPVGVFEAVVVSYDSEHCEWCVKFDSDQVTEDFDLVAMVHYVIDEYTTPMEWKGTNKEQKRQAVDSPIIVNNPANS